MTDLVDNSNLLIDPKTRSCMRGHGTMTLNEELLALQAVTRNAPGPGHPMIALGKAYGVRMFVCAQCGSVELVDEEFIK